MRRAVWPVVVAAGMAFVILLSLGTWQLQRLAWKQGLIARIENQMAAAPEIYQPNSAQGSEDYQKLSMTGQFAQTPPLRFMATRQGVAGWRLLHRFDLQGGGSVIVDRGVAPEASTPAAPAAAVTIVGVTQRHAQGQGMFDPLNDLTGNQWFWWDLPTMAKALRLNEVNANHFVLRLLPKEPGTDGLFVEMPRAELRNNHLGYAITWFGLAAVLVVMTAVFLVQIRRSAA